MHSQSLKNESQEGKKLKKSTERAFKRHFWELESFVKANPNDTVFRCCMQSIRFMITKTDIRVTPDFSGLFGPTSFSLTDYKLWREWFDLHKRKKTGSKTINAKLPSPLAAIMNHLPFIILVAFIGSCQINKKSSNDVNSSKDTTIILMDSLGGLTLSIPKDTDTFITWIRRTDCGIACEEGKYRFQAKNHRVFKESGFFWIGQPQDSVNQLTISHHRGVIFSARPDSIAIKQHRSFKEYLLADPSTRQITRDTIEYISDSYFSLFEISDYNKIKGIFSRRLVAFTTIRGNRIRFQYDLLTKHNDLTLVNFLEVSTKNLRSVRLNNGS